MTSYVITDFGMDETGRSIAVQSDGKILVAGESDGRFALARYNTNGSLDTTFSGDGKVTAEAGSGYSVTVQADGKILLAGDSQNYFVVLRYNTDGTLDTSFDGDGRTRTYLTYWGADAKSVIVQADGKIVAAGTCDSAYRSSDFALVRYNTDGSLDATFGAGGIVTTTLNDSGDLGEAVALQPDGKLVVAGSSGYDFALVRYNTNGSLDTSFGSDGKVKTAFGSSSSHGSSVVLQADGKILVAGNTIVDAGYISDFALVRYNTDGSLDYSFGVAGKVTTDVGGYQDWAHSVIVSADGKILLAGYNNDDFALVRYNTNGSLDTTFSGDGKVTTDFGLETGKGYAVTLQADGKILVAGTSEGSAYPYVGDFAVVRYNADGTLDTSFGAPPDVTAPTVATFSPADEATNVAIASNIVVTFSEAIANGTGSIILKTAAGVTVATYDAATSSNLTISGSTLTLNPTSDLDYGTGYTVEFASGSIKDLAGNSYAGTTSYNVSTGSAPDTSGTGKVITDLGGSDTAGGVAVQTDGKILVAGGSRVNDNEDFALVRYNVDGTLDRSFSSDGIVTTDFFGSTDSGMEVTVQPDGKILVAGLSYVNGSFDFALARYNVDGSFDTSFSGDGKVTTDFFSGSSDEGYSLVVQTDGKILVAGYSYSNRNSDIALVRYNADGTLDTSFSGDGKVTTDFGASDSGQGVTVQTDGKILVAGYSFDSSGSDFVVVRYNVDGTLDTGFSGDGKVTTDFGASDYGYGVTVQTDGKILVAGSSGVSLVNVDFALVRYNTDGTLDTSFSGDGKVTTDFGAFDDGYSIVVQADGKILVAGSSYVNGSGNIALVRYNVDGSLDTSFSGDGKVTTDLGDGDSGKSVTVQADGKILVAGYSGHYTGFVVGTFDFAIVRYNIDGSLDTSFGVPADTTAPTVATFSPTDEATGIAIGNNIVVTFSEAIAKGTGSIILKTAAGATVATYDAATSSNLAISGNTLTINPTADLAYSTGYKIEFAAGTIKDLAGNSYAGTTSYNFTTVSNIAGQTFTGTSGNDSFTSTTGNDSIDGGAGLDTVLYSGTRASHTLTQTSSGWTVSSGPDGTDTIQNIERLQFSDETLALDISGVAGQAYRVYQAAFNRTPDNAGLKFWIDGMDKGTSLHDVAAGFINSAEFQSIYGINPTNEQFVTNLYAYVMHRPLDQAGYDFWVGDLNANRISRIDTLVQFSEAAENQANVIGVIQNGIELFV